AQSPEKRQNAQQEDVKKQEFIADLTQIKSISESFLNILEQNFVPGSVERNEGLLLYTELQSSQNRLVNRLIVDIQGGKSFSASDYSSMQNKLNRQYDKFTHYVRNTIDRQKYKPKSGVIEIIGVLVEISNHLYENWAKAEEAKKQEIIRILEGLKLASVK
ncbi:MAG: hypothetical protein ACKVTZ_18250, partial [Bacteroidia bacterium]